ncbi:MAG: HD domain-containing phosphohydrolase [Sulfuricurvum sp.]|jgi:putative nucleotidyltransferase with HDIG domain
MAKIVVNRIINHTYAQHDPDILLQDTVIPFDCYIKRYADYVIIIEAGTYISAALLQKISSNEKIYILASDTEKLQTYHIAHDYCYSIKNDAVTMEEAINAASDLPNALSEIVTNEEKFSFVYATSATLMETIFDSGQEQLPVSAIYTCMEQLVTSVNLETNAVGLLFKNISGEYTAYYHSTNVAFLAVILATKLGLSEEDRIGVGHAGLLHDIGKIKIDQELLLKASYLEDNEFEIIKQHSEYGYIILKNNGITDKKVLDGVHFHHENLNGSGYPKGLRGKLIPKYAKIVGVCDAFDALTTKRTFRDSYTSYEALIVMKREMALQFDEHYIGVFIKLLQ